MIDIDGNTDMWIKVEPRSAFLNLWWRKRVTVTGTLTAEVDNDWKSK